MAMFTWENQFFDGWDDEEPVYFYPCEITHDFEGLKRGQYFAVAKYIRRTSMVHFYDDMEDDTPVVSVTYNMSDLKLF